MSVNTNGQAYTTSKLCLHFLHKIHKFRIFLKLIYINNHFHHWCFLYEV